MIRKQDSFIDRKEEVSVIWIEGHTNHNIPVSQNLTQRRALPPFTSVKDKKDEDAAEEKHEGSRGCFGRFKERNHSHNIKGQSEAASASVEAAASHPAGLAWRIEEGVQLNYRFSV